MQSSMNFADRALLWFFMLAISLIAVRAYRVAEWPLLIGVNVVCLGLITVFVAMRRRNEFWWMFVHDWYPMAMFIVCFEEVSRLSFVIRDGWQDHFLLAFEAKFFSVPPTVWLGQHGSGWITEILEIGYFSYFAVLMIVGGMLYPSQDRRKFRRVMDATVLAYMVCYAVFIFFPTEGPAHTLASSHLSPLPGGGPFHWMVGLIQRNAGVHGNAFPSAHVAGAVVALFFAWQYLPRVRWALTVLVSLLCVGAVYDRYHYASDVVGGALVGLGAALWIIVSRRNEASNHDAVAGDVLARSAR
jgi:membrane-associated phospholipid phosphatase